MTVNRCGPPCSFSGSKEARRAGGGNYAQVSMDPRSEPPHRAIFGPRPPCHLEQSSKVINPPFPLVGAKTHTWDNVFRTRVTALHPPHFVRTECAGCLRAWDLLPGAHGVSMDGYRAFQPSTPNGWRPPEDSSLQGLGGLFRHHKADLWPGTLWSLGIGPGPGVQRSIVFSLFQTS